MLTLGDKYVYMFIWSQSNDHYPRTESLSSVMYASVHNYSVVLFYIYLHIVYGELQRK